MNIEDIWLDHGNHDPKDGKGCVMEWVGVKWLMQHGWTMSDAWAALTDSPACTDPVVYRAAQQVNDRLGDEDRQRLVPLIDRLARCHTPGDDRVARRVRVRVACWSARSVLDLILDDERRAVALRAICAAEAWLRGEAGVGGCRAATDAATYATDAATYATYAATYATYAATYAADATYAAADATYAAANATTNAAANAERDLVLWLDELLDAWEKACAEEGVLADEPPVPA